MPLKVNEIFFSIQGESSHAGRACAFVRLTGCNLRCGYCDTEYAYEEGEELTIDEVVAAISKYPARLVEVTGGEPLLQGGFRALAERLRDETGKIVLVETNGSRDISVIPDGVVAVMDVKCPSSGESAATDLENLARLRPGDKIKFVIGDRRDYEWAAEIVTRYAAALAGHPVLFSPVWEAPSCEGLAPWVLADGLPVRLQVQLHKVWGLR